MNQAMRVADAARDNWVDRFAPAWFRPYARLARYDRPIGAWLLFWPCAFSAGLAALAAGLPGPDPMRVLLFLVGAFMMRGAGCTWNDIVDRDIDAKVARTASRPLPSGQVTTRKAAMFLVLQMAVAFAILLTFDGFSILVGCASLAPVASYPFMKRITWWPQAMLGICFGWGSLMGWSDVFHSLAPAALVLYAGAIAWIIGYDTIYALQDIEDDALVGVRSTARLFGSQVQVWVAGFYLATVSLFAVALAMVSAGVPSFIGLAAFAAMLARQVALVPGADPRLALALFKSNSPAALMLFAGLVVDAFV